MTQQNESADGDPREEEQSSAGPVGGQLLLVGIPVGNMGDMTPRGTRALQAADVVICDDFKQGAKVLRELNLSNRLVEMTEDNEEEILEEIAGHLRGGRTVAVMRRGTLSQDERGPALVGLALELGIEPKVFPGVSPIVAAVMASGFPADEFELYGAISRRPDERREAAMDLMLHPGTVVLFETPYRLRSLLTALAATMSDRDAVLTVNLTSPGEAILRGTLGEIVERFAEKKLRGEFVLVLGPYDASRAPLDLLGALAPEALDESGDSRARHGMEEADDEIGEWLGGDMGEEQEDEAVEQESDEERGDDEAGPFVRRKPLGTGDRRGSRDHGHAGPGRAQDTGGDRPVRRRVPGHSRDFGDRGERREGRPTGDRGRPRGFDGGRARGGFGGRGDEGRGFGGRGTEERGEARGFGGRGREERGGYGRGEARGGYTGGGGEGRGGSDRRGGGGHGGRGGFGGRGGSVRGGGEHRGGFGSRGGGEERRGFGGRRGDEERGGFGGRGGGAGRGGFGGHGGGPGRGGGAGRGGFGGRGGDAGRGGFGGRGGDSGRGGFGGRGGGGESHGGFGGRPGGPGRGGRRNGPPRGPRGGRAR